MKKVCVLIFIILHLLITRFVVRIIDAMVQIDGDWIYLLLAIILVNVCLFLIFRKIYKKMFDK